MSTLFDTPLGELLDTEGRASLPSDLAVAMTVRMARLAFAVSAQLRDEQLVNLLAFHSSAQLLTAFADVLASQHASRSTAGSSTEPHRDLRTSHADDAGS